MSTPVVIPVTGNVDPALLQGLVNLATGITAAGAATDDARKKAAGAKSGWGELFASVGTGAQHFNNIRGALTGMAEDLGAAVARVTALADEQTRLAESSARLGLDFDEGAAAAGRFVDETAAMGVASQFAARDIRLSQTELNNLMRVAGATAATLGTDVATAADRLAQSLIRGEAEGLSPFGGSLVSVAGGAHTVGERLAAMGMRAGEVATATDTATTRMERFKDSLEDGQRLMAHAFVDELARLSEVGGGLRDVNTDAESFNTTLRAAGQTAASMVTRVVLGVGIIGGGIATVLGGLTGMVQLAAAATHGLAAFNAERDRLAREGLSAESWRFVQSAADRLEALDADEGPRTTAAPTPAAAAAPRPGAADANARNRRQGGAGGGRTARAADMTFTAEQAASEEQAARIRDLDDIAGLAHDRSQQRIDEEIAGRIREERAANEAIEAQKQAAQDALGIAAMEDANLRERLEAHRTFTGHLRELYGEQANAAQVAAEVAHGAFEDIGGAIAKNVELVAQGRMSLKELGEAILADGLNAIAKRMYAKGAEFAAEALGFAALGDFPQAGLALVASAGFFATGAALGVAGAAAAPAPPSTGGGGSGGAGGISRAPAAPTSSEGGGAVVNNYYAPTFGGREGTSAEAGEHMSRYTAAAARRQRDS